MPYEFTPESFIQFRDDVINAGGDQANLSIALADMQEAFVNGIGRVSAAEESASASTAECERLRTVNASLLLKIGETIPKSPDSPADPETPKYDSPESYMKDWFEKHPKGR